jgi:hypothetical protein
MKVFKDKILIFIGLTILGLVYLMTSRGHWETNLEQDSAVENNRVNLTNNLSIESEHFIGPDNLTVGSNTYLFVTKNCIQIDTVSIRMFEKTDDQEKEIKNTKRRIADMDSLVWDSNYNLSDESFIKSIKIKLCPGQRIEIGNWFNYSDAKTEDFIIEYNIKDDNGTLLTKRINLERKTEFEILGKNHYDFIILLYPVLLTVLGLLIIIKIIKTVRKKYSTQQNV